VRKLRGSKKVVASNIVGLDDDELMENPGRKRDEMNYSKPNKRKLRK